MGNGYGTDQNIMDQVGMAAPPPLSLAGTGRIYFDATDNVFKVSQNGGAFANLVGGGGGSVDGADIIDETVTGGKLADDTITGDKISNNTITGDKIVDSTIPFTKVQVNSETFVNLSTTPQSLNGGVALASGTYAFKITIPNGDTVLFLFLLAVGNPFSFTVPTGVVIGGTLALGASGGFTTYQFTMLDGLVYYLRVEDATGIISARVQAGTATGNTNYSWNRVL